MKLSLMKTSLFTLGLGIAGLSFAEPNEFVCNGTDTKLVYSASNPAGQPSLTFNGRSNLIKQADGKGEKITKAWNQKATAQSPEGVLTESTSLGTLVSFESESHQGVDAKSTVRLTLRIPPILNGEGDFDTIIIGTSTLSGVDIRLSGPQNPIVQILKVKCSYSTVQSLR